VTASPASIRTPASSAVLVANRSKLATAASIRRASSTALSRRPRLDTLDGETSQTQQDNFPTTDVFAHVEVADGRVWMLPDGADSFAGDLLEHEQKLVWATHFAPAADLFLHEVKRTAWKSKPSWYIVAKNDRTVQPELERFFAERMGATTYEVESSHVPMLSNPELVLDVIRTAARAVTEPFVAA
jgi:pimeloyl-ACP methyl ester carboxylesterase